MTSTLMNMRGTVEHWQAFPSVSICFSLKYFFGKENKGERGGRTDTHLSSTSAPLQWDWWVYPSHQYHPVVAHSCLRMGHMSGGNLAVFVMMSSQLKRWEGVSWQKIIQDRQKPHSVPGTSPRSRSPLRWSTKVWHRVLNLFPAWLLVLVRCRSRHV